MQNLRYPSNINRLLNGTPGALAVGGGWCPVIRLNQYTDWSFYAKHLPRSLISDQRRQWSRAREVLPGLSFKLIKDNEDIELTINWILDQKLKWLKEKNKSQLNFRSNEMQDFFAHISRAAKDSLVLAKLSDGETIISAGFGYRFKDEFLFHVFSYDKTWNKLSPSRLFLEGLVRWCFDNGVNTFDFMPGDEQYKTIWATDLVRTDSYVAPLTLWGVFVLWWHRQRPKHLSAPKILGKTYNYLPGWLRQRIRSKLAQLCISELEIKPRPEMPSLAINSRPR
jgi:CelD/BcsL family acetyltransferase involved in cellulose biosynthesis